MPRQNDRAAPYELGTRAGALINGRLCATIPVSLGAAASRVCPTAIESPVFDTIEKLKQELTDKYVVVDATVPQLARFEGYVGQVRTVNMSGRALVEFDAWSNIGWYDIEPAYLKVVPKPEAKPAEKKQAPAKAAKPAAKPAAAAGGKKLSPLEMARMQGPAKGAGAGQKAAPAAGAAKKSTADILAAARGEKSTAAKPAAKDKPSTADILAAARANKPTAAAAPATKEEPPPAEPAAPAAAAEPAPATEAEAAAEPAFPPGQRPSVPEILDWCRKHDAK